MSGKPPAGQVWDAGGYAHHAGFVPALGQAAVALLAPRPGETILDMGCGDGALTGALVRAGASVTGLEPDPSLAAAARARGLSVLQQDAHDAFGDAAFDAVFSNAALHWMRNPERVIANAFAALRPGGRLVAEQGGFGNVAAVVTALCAALESAGLTERAASPWDFPSPTGQRARLERAGFSVIEIASIPRPTPLPTGIAGWLATFAGPFVEGLERGARTAILGDAERRLGALHDPAEGWMADYVRLRFKAVKPA